MATPSKKKEVSVELITNFGIKDAEKILEKNTANRPLRPGLVKRYALEMLRKKWKLNGETFSLDWNNNIISCQHRAAALVKAEEMRKDDVEYWREEYGWKGPVTIPIILVKNVDPKTADTVDLGQKRTGGDVLYRRHEFNGKGKKYTDGQIRKMSNDLAVAIRLVWLRTGGKKVSDAPYFPHSEMLDFLEEHPELHKAVEFVFNEDDDRKISTRVSRGYFAGLMFLFAHAKLKGAKALCWDEAEKFVTQFASGENLKKENPIYELRELYTRQLAKQGGRDRDTDILNPAVKAWNAFLDKKKLTSRNIKTKSGEETRIGGLDVEVVVEEEVVTDDE